MTRKDTEFEDLTARGQVTRLRPTAFAALADYDIDVARVRVIHHGYNATFRVDSTDGRRFALRLNVNSHKTPADLHAEMSWLAALAVETDLSIPTPVLTRDGRLTTNAWNEALARSLPAAVFHWLPGPVLEQIAQPVHLRALGQAMAALHTHAERWSLPEGATLPASDDVLMHGTDHLAREHPLLTDERRAVIDAAMASVQPHFRAVGAGLRAHPLHADLHLGNLKWHRGRLSLFDFDDCVIGVPAHDLAVSTYYLRPRAELEAALRDGYVEARPLPVVADAAFESLIAGRNLLLLNELCGTQTADFRAFLPAFLDNTVLKLRAFLDTGVYRHDTPGVVPIA